ncbi:MAG TPA: DUF6153 family protein [Nocardioides sp.]|nr:DUF6153 family protein [Nocardioides sp.]
MGDPRTASTSPGTRLALAAVAVALFGLLSMHGWGSHATHAVTVTPQGAGLVQASAHHAMHESPADHTPAPGDDGELVGMCLAVLAAALLGIVTLLVRRGVPVPRAVLRAWSHPASTGRDRDPPDLLRLCVIRV